MFGKKTKEIDDILRELDLDKQITVNHQVGRLSEALCKRDSFFHSCWTRLKFERPDLFETMGKVEVFIAGYDPEPEVTEKEDSDDDPNEGIVL
jgi:hypothetical protein